MKALVYVTLKPDVLDPQGEAIRKACGTLGHSAVRSVRQGKLFEIELDASDPAEAKRLPSDEEGTRGMSSEERSRLRALGYIQ